MSRSSAEGSEREQARDASRRVGSLMPLVEVAKIADPELRRIAMLERLDDIYDAARHRSRLNKHGETIEEPDCATATKVVQTASALLGVEQMHGSAELERLANEAKLRVVAALSAIPGLADTPGTLERQRAVLAVLRDVGVIAALKPNSDIAGTIGTLRAAVQVLRIGTETDDEFSDDELKTMAHRLTTESK